MKLDFHASALQTSCHLVTIACSTLSITKLLNLTDPLALVGLSSAIILQSCSSQYVSV